MIYYKIILPTNGGENVCVKFDKNNIHIDNSYKITSTKEMKSMLILIKGAAENRGIIYKRSMRSWIKEWQAHNILYKLGIKPSSSKDVDMDEDETKGRLFVYNILSLFYWK